MTLNANDAENAAGEDADGQPAGDDKCLVKILGELCTRRQNGRVGRSEISSLSLFSFKFTFHVLFWFETTIYKLANLLEILNNLKVGFFAQPGAWRPSRTPPVVNKEVLVRWKIDQLFVMKRFFFYIFCHHNQSHVSICYLHLLRGLLNQLSSLSVSVGLSSIWPCGGQTWHHWVCLSPWFNTTIIDKFDMI